MKIALPQQQFLKHLQMVEHTINERSTLPILANVLIQAEGNNLVLMATDLDIGIQCRVPLSQQAVSGAVTLPARKLTTIVRELPDTVVTLEAMKNHTALLNCGTSSFRIPGLPAEDFPTLPAAQEADKILISQADLKKLIKRTAYAMSSEETRFVLNGTLVLANKGSLTLVATDGRRLALATTALKEGEHAAVEVIIPSKMLRELDRLLQEDNEEPVTVTPLQDNQVMFRFEPVTMITRLIEGQFPPYKKVIPPATKTVMSCPRKELTDAIRRASLMTTATSQAVIFDVDENRLIVSKESPEIGSAREELAVSYSGEKMRIAFNPLFWIEAFKTIDGDEVRIELGGAERPAVIREDDFTYIVLPMKTA